MTEKAEYSKLSLLKPKVDVHDSDAVLQLHSQPSC